MNFRLKIQDLLGNVNIGEWYDLVTKSQYWSKDKLIDYQEDNLRKIIHHAYKNVPYYYELFNDLGLNPSDIRTINDLEKLPILTSEELKQNSSRLLASNFKRFKPQHRRTGGTTGAPLWYYSDMNSWALHWALKYRTWEWGGYQIGDPIGLLGGASIIPESKAGFKRKIWNKLNGFVPLPSSHLFREQMYLYADIIRNKRIHYLRGYPSSIATFSNFCADNDIQLNIKSVYTTAEVLQDTHKTDIKNYLKASVFDTYGCADGGGNANTCEYENGFHVSMEASIWEVCDTLGERTPTGSTGEVTLTSLTNYVMPLIRYQPGDLIENSFDYSVCQCGRSLPRINKIVGK